MTIPHRIGGLRTSLTSGLATLISVGVLLVGCAPGAPGARGEQQASGTSPGPKVLRLGIAADAEPTEGGIYGARSAGGFEPIYLLHAGLTVYNTEAALQLQPWLAERVPTIENGEWQMLPDGRMELTWKLRSDVRWHDGTPLAAEDLVLGFRVALEDPFGRGTRVLRLVEEVSAPDPQTLVMRWKSVYIFANAMGLDTALLPLPRHRFAALWDAGDKQAFAASPYLSDEWIGLGPYRLREWLRASHIDTVAYDDYFLGKPKIDRAIIRYFGDTNALVVTFMAGDLDLLPVGSMKEGEAHVLKTQWADAGAGSVIVSEAKLRQGMWQLRDPSALWARDVRVRQALVNLIDRQTIAETVQHGLSSVDDIALLRGDPAYRLAQQRGLPKLNFDVSQAHRLLAEAGLNRGVDGLYRSEAGAPFAIQLSTTGDIQTNIQEMLAISNVWKTAGLEPDGVIIPGTANKDEVRTRLQGVNLTSSDLSYRAFEAYLTSEISSEATRWRGQNIAGYSNPAYDQQVTRLFTTVNSTERDGIAADLVKLSLDQVLYIPLTYSSDVSAVRKEVRGVTGVQRPQPVTAWNAHLWVMG